MKDLYCTIKEGWQDDGKRGRVLGVDMQVNGIRWTPVQWDDDEDLDFHKTRGLVFDGPGYGFTRDENGFFGSTK